MLNFFRRWIYERRRAVFRYWDGERICTADPIAIWRAILADPKFEIERDTSLIEDRNDGAAWVRCIAAVRRAFQINDGPLTEQEIYEIWQAFCLRVSALKKNFSHWPTQLPHSTDIAPQFGQIWPPPPMPRPGSTSTPDAPNYEQPVALRMG